MVEEENNKTSFCQPIQNAIFGNMERFYNWFGQKVARYPVWVILGVLAFSGICSAGFFILENETDQLELWVPTDSDFYRSNKWISQTFPSAVRPQNIMLVTENGDNILKRQYLDVWFGILKEVTKIK